MLTLIVSRVMCDESEESELLLQLSGCNDDTNNSLDSVIRILTRRLYKLTKYIFMTSPHPDKEEDPLQ